MVSLLPLSSLVLFSTNILCSLNCSNDLFFHRAWGDTARGRPSWSSSWLRRFDFIFIVLRAEAVVICCLVTGMCKCIAGFVVYIFFIFVSSDLPCSHFCIDNSTCGCFKGYQLQSDAVSCEGKQNIVVSEDRVMNKDGRCIAVLQKQKKIQGSSSVFCFLKETRKGSNLRLAIFVLIFSFFPLFFCISTTQRLWF